MKLLFATGNKNKYEFMKERLKPLTNIELITPKMLDLNINVIEDGNTPISNAIKKARAYYEVTHMPVIAEDSGLYIDEFSSDEQPGLFVKRVNGKDGLSDEEVINYYINKLNEHGGESLASYHTGVCLIDVDGNIYTDLISNANVGANTLYSIDKIVKYKTDNMKSINESTNSFDALTRADDILHSALTLEENLIKMFNVESWRLSYCR